MLSGLRCGQTSSSSRCSSSSCYSVHRASSDGSKEGSNENHQNVRVARGAGTTTRVSAALWRPGGDDHRDLHLTLCGGDGCVEYLLRLHGLYFPGQRSVLRCRRICTGAFV